MRQGTAEKGRAMVTQPIILESGFVAVPDDTEESLVGSAGHQETIHVSYDGLRICAVRRQLPWFVGNQLFLLILQDGDDGPRRIAPDVMVYPEHTLPDDPKTIAVALHGPPYLILEIASPSTAKDFDLNLRDRRARPQLYERIGVSEYLVYDPSGEMLGERVWALRRGPNGFAPWLSESDRRWHSGLGVSFAPQGTLLRVYDHDGNLVPLSVEFDAMLMERDRRNAEADRRNAELSQRNAELEAELRRLRGDAQ